jgi:hypothetical protein
MFRALFAHPPEVLHKRNLVYCVRVYQLAAQGTELEIKFLVQPIDVTARNKQNAARGGLRHTP